MCNTEVKSIPTDIQPRPGSRRKNIWELNPSYHCPIVGTCFTLKELRKLYERIHGKNMSSGYTDHEIHTFFSCSATDSGFPTRLLNKVLNRKYGRCIASYQKVESSNELGELWDEAVDLGDIPAAFWSLITHPLASKSLVHRVYGEVHMMSHLAGASARADLHQLKILKNECNTLKTKLNKANNKASSTMSKYQNMYRRFKQQRDQAQRTERVLKDTEKGLRNLESDAQINLLRKQNTLLEQKLVYEKTRITKEIEHWAEMVDERDKEIAEFKSKCAQYERVCSSETECTENHDPGYPQNQICALDLKPAVEGRNVLYVGGLSKLTPHLRALVEDNGGKFLHHDGGINDGAMRLTGLLEQADTVLCPLDCISHNACHKVKRLCKQHAKPMVMLRKPSLSSFVRGLQETISIG